MESVTFISFYNCKSRVVQKITFIFFFKLWCSSKHTWCALWLCVWDTILSMYWTVLLSEWLYSPDTAWMEWLPGLVAVHHEVLNSQTSW